MGDVFSPDLAADLPEVLLPDRGRGLLLVQCHADAFWWEPVEIGGKAIYCRFDLDSDRLAP
ncbi:hypothetical protein ACIHFE_18775 [Streptomyces sp. NPDC052396]|uniref:hypothetical protein n=1 Tax=Streptomyces sp. NPDC052396 TaxID=3365689 RepID=UPI0037D946F8